MDRIIFLMVHFQKIWMRRSGLIWLIIMVNISQVILPYLPLPSFFSLMLYCVTLIGITQLFLLDSEELTNHLYKILLMNELEIHLAKLIWIYVYVMISSVVYYVINPATYGEQTVSLGPIFITTTLSFGVVALLYKVRSNWAKLGYYLLSGIVMQIGVMLVGLIPIALAGSVVIFILLNKAFIHERNIYT